MGRQASRNSIRRKTCPPPRHRLLCCMACCSYAFCTSLLPPFSSSSSWLQRKTGSELLHFFIFLLLRLPVFSGLPMKIFFPQHVKGGRVHQGTLGRWPYIFPVFTCVLASPFFVPSRRGIPGSSAIAPPHLLRRSILARKEHHRTRHPCYRSYRLPG